MLCIMPHLNQSFLEICLILPFFLTPMLSKYAPGDGPHHIGDKEADEDKGIWEKPFTNTIFDFIKLGLEVRKEGIFEAVGIAVKGN
jgi:hypothetical protein